MERVIEPEWLDDLPPDDPKAIGSRAGLRRLNSLMGHVGRMHGTLQNLFQKTEPKRIIEIGAGDGSFLLKLIHRTGWKNTEIILLDRQPAISSETKIALGKIGCKIQFVQADVFAWLPNAPKADCIMANLFLHHFQPEALQQLFGLISQASDAFAAGEPRRYAAAMAVSRCLGLIGCNEVTRHDAVISVRAGFNGSELSQLWPKGEWDLSEKRGGLSSHWFVARKK